VHAAVAERGVFLASPALAIVVTSHGDLRHLNACGVLCFVHDRRRASKAYTHAHTNTPSGHNPATSGVDAHTHNPHSPAPFPPTSMAFTCAHVLHLCQHYTRRHSHTHDSITCTTACVRARFSRLQSDRPAPQVCWVGLHDVDCRAFCPPCICICPPYTASFQADR